jgi:ELWxxDGT repeat protein
MRVLSLLLLLLSLPSIAHAAPRFVPIADAELATVRSSDPKSFRRIGPYVFFLAKDWDARELWRTDGTPAGTIRLAQIPFADSFAGEVGNVAVVQGGGNPRPIWRSDGTPEGTWKMADVPLAGSTGSGFGVHVATTSAHVYLFVGQGSEKPHEVFAASVAPSATFAHIGPVPANLSAGTIAIRSTLYFVGSTPGAGSQVWISNGTTQGTRVLARATECFSHACVSPPSQLLRLGDEVFYFSDDGLYRADGMPVAELERPVLLAGSNSVAYFLAEMTLYGTDGTTTGTRAIGALESRPVDAAVTDRGELLYALWTYNTSHFYLTDGARAAERIASIPAQPNAGGRVAIVGRTLFYSGTSPANGVELWRLGFDERTPSLVADLDPRQDFTTPLSSEPSRGAAIGPLVVFPATNLNGRELWVTDGTPAGTTQLANIAADDGAGSVAGIARDAATGAAVADAAVFLCTTECPTNTRSGADGSYRFDGVAPGTFTIQALTFDHITATTESFEVRVGQSTSGVDVALVRGAHIGGKLTRASNGAPVGGWKVVVRKASGAIATTTTTWSTGVYRTRGLASGSYYLETQRPVGTPAGLVNQVYRERHCLDTCQALDGDPLLLTEGVDVENIDFALREYGTISGTVRDSAGQPLRGASVTFQWSPTVSGVIVGTDEEGRYKSSLLPPRTYYVTAGASGFSRMSYPNIHCGELACTFTGATPVQVNMDGQVTGIDFALKERGGRITGTLLDRTGAPLANISLKLVGQNGAAISWTVTTDAKTDEKGRFIFHSLPPATYYLQREYELLPHVPCPRYPCTVAGATPIPVVDGQTATPSIQLDVQRIVLEGEVRDARTGALLKKPGSVRLYSSPGALLAEASSGYGTYKLDTLMRETEVHVVASVGEYHRAAHPNLRLNCASDVVCIPPGAKLVPAGQHRIDFALDPRGAIFGTVVDAATRKPVEKAEVRFLSSEGREGGTYTDEEGRYRWQYANGSYWVHASRSMYNGQVHPGRNCIGKCDPKTGDLVTAPDGTDVRVDFVLETSPALGAITGRVVDDVTGAPIPDAYVVIYKAGTSSRLMDTRTDSDGRYVLDDREPYQGLVSGQYVLWVEVGTPYFTALSGGKHCADYYACDRTSGTPVTVNAPQTTTGVDFRLVRLDVTSITPSLGPPAGGNEIVITGTQFTPETTVTIGGKAAPIVRQTQSELVVLAPAGAEGFAHLAVTVSQYRTATLLHAYEYTTRTSSKRRRTTGS